MGIIISLSMSYVLQCNDSSLIFIKNKKLHWCIWWNILQWILINCYGVDYWNELCCSWLSWHASRRWKTIWKGKHVSSGFVTCIIVIMKWLDTIVFMWLLVLGELETMYIPVCSFFNCILFDEFILVVHFDDNDNWRF